MNQLIVRCVCSSELRLEGRIEDTGQAKQSFIKSHYQCRVDMEQSRGRFLPKWKIKTPGGVSNDQ